MSSISSPERQIIETLLVRLKTITPNVLLGYSAIGLEQDTNLPAILVQLESITETARQGGKARYQLQFNISAVTKTNDSTTYSLIDLSKAIRDALVGPERLLPQTRKINVSDAQFDIAPSNSHLSFSDTSLLIEAVL